MCVWAAQQLLNPLCPCLSPLSLSLQVYVNRRASGGEVTQQVPTETKRLFWHKHPSERGRTTHSSSSSWFQCFNHVIYWKKKRQHFSVRGHCFPGRDDRFVGKGGGDYSATKPHLLCVSGSINHFLSVLSSLPRSQCRDLPTMVFNTPREHECIHVQHINTLRMSSGTAQHSQSVVLCLRGLSDLACYCRFGSDLGRRAELQWSLWNELLCTVCLL